VRQETFRIRGIYFIVIGLRLGWGVGQRRVGILFKWYMSRTIRSSDEKRKEGWGIDTYTYIADLGIDAT